MQVGEEAERQAWGAWDPPPTVLADLCADSLSLSFPTVKQKDCVVFYFCLFMILRRHA